MGEEVAGFGQELQKIVQFLGVSRGQMQMGQMRFEPNINVHITTIRGSLQNRHHRDQKPQQFQRFGACHRQRNAPADPCREETGSLGRKSTYGWDEATESTVHQHDKENANDYRYFPDPDLAPVEVDDAWLLELTSQIGELPVARRQHTSMRWDWPRRMRASWPANELSAISLMNRFARARTTAGGKFAH